MISAQTLPVDDANPPEATPPSLDVTVGHRQVIGAITWEYVGQFGSEQVPSLPPYGSPYDVADEAPDAGFPARALGSRMYSADGGVWKAVAVDEARAYEQANDYLGFERYSPRGDVNPIPPQFWDDLGADVGEDPSTFVTGDEVYLPDPTDGIAYPESNSYNTISCDYSSYSSSGGGWLAPDIYALLHPDSVDKKYLLNTVWEGGETEPPYIGDPGFSASENGPIVRILMGITEPNIAGPVISGRGFALHTSDGVLLQGPGNCSGVLVASDKVLTAAHCLYPPNELNSVWLDFHPSFFTVCTEGGQIRSGAEQCRKVSNIFVPDTYTGYFTSDWMLLKLEQPIDLAKARPMALSLVDPTYLKNNGIPVSLQGYPAVPHASTPAAMCATPNHVGMASTMSFWDWSDDYFPSTSIPRNDYKFRLPDGSIPAGARRWVDMPFNVRAWSSRRFRSTGTVKNVYEKSVMLAATHGPGYSGAPYYYNGRYVFGVHSIHYTSGFSVSTAGPRTSYWIVDMLNGLYGI